MERFTVHSILILSLLVAILLAGFSSQASTLQTPEPLDVILIMDESGSMAPYITALQRSADALAQAMTALSSSRLGLIGYGAVQGHANTVHAGEAHLHLDLTSNMTQLNPSSSDLIALGTGGSAFEAIMLALQRLSGAQSQNGCIMLITDHSPGVGAPQESLSQSLSQAHAKLVEVLALPELAQALQLAKGRGSTQDSPLLAGASQLFNINQMLQDTAAFYQQVLQSCNQTGQAATSNLQGLGAADDAALQGISLLSPTFERLQSQIEINQIWLHDMQSSIQAQSQSGSQIEGSERVEKILQEHTAKIDLLEQNLQSLAPRLVNVPTLEELKSLVQQQSDAITALGTTLSASISELKDRTATLNTSLASLDQRLTLVEALTGRVATLEQGSQVSSQQQSEAAVQIKNISASISQIDQQLAALQSNLAGLPLDQLKTQLDGITSQVSASQSDIKTLASQFNDLQNNLNSLDQKESQQADQQSAAMGALATQLGSLSALVKDLPIPAIDSRLQALEADVKAIPQQQEGLARLGDSLIQLQNQTTAIQAAVTGLPIADLSDGLHALASHLEQAQSNSQAESQRLADQLKAQSDQGQAADEKLASQIAASQKESAQADQAQDVGIKSLVGRATSVESRADSLENSTTSQQKAIQDQEQKIEELTGQLDELQKAVASNASDLKQLTAQLERENDQQDSNTKQLAATTQAGLQAQRDTFTAGIADAKQRLDAITAAVQAISSQMSQLHDLDAQDQQFKLDLGQLQNQVAAVDKSLDALNAIFSGLNEETKKNIIDLLQKRFSEMDHEIDVLHHYMFALGAGLLVSALGIIYLLLQ
ncbi:VWA domain-containing protein [Candidatus Acetothermia bacterium]|nr:VWA domain-containing protein [Candidatus Acetothermia bacterium]MBI3643605.1 VWA domain-containing protein [Candidatus Acetothermia bacterium]